MTARRFVWGSWFPLAVLVARNWVETRRRRRGRRPGQGRAGRRGGLMGYPPRPSRRATDRPGARYVSARTSRGTRPSSAPWRHASEACPSSRTSLASRYARPRRCGPSSKRSRRSGTICSSVDTPGDAERSAGPRRRGPLAPADAAGGARRGSPPHRRIMSVPGARRLAPVPERP